MSKHTIPDEILSMETSLPKASYDNLPQWKGFNLLNKFNGRNDPFDEKVFEYISRMGYNFVRLPMDYRMWTRDGDWYKIDEATIAEIDRAVGYGIRHSIHVDLNFHRAPGYTVATPPEKTNLLTDSEAQQAFAFQWRMFARRYKGISSDVLSFNLVNEPAGVNGKTYANAVTPAVNAIHEEDPDRLIIADGLEYGRIPVPELVPLKVAQSFRGYEPFRITHYKAGWVNGADMFPEPQWPAMYEMNGYLYGNSKKELQSPLIIKSEDGFPACEAGIFVNVISMNAEIVIYADGREVYNKKIVCSDGEGEWERAVFRQEWNTYQNIFNREYKVKIPAGTKNLEFAVKEGDWLTFSEVCIRPEGREPIILKANSAEWGKRSDPLTIRSDGVIVSSGFDGGMAGSDWLISKYMNDWKEFSEQNGIGIMIGEWGVHNQTPHDVTLRLMEDMLKAFRKLNMGWALWNLDGSFGIINSGRKDVQYVEFEGQKLDKIMSDLLLIY